MTRLAERDSFVRFSLRNSATDSAKLCGESHFKQDAADYLDPAGLACLLQFRKGFLPMLQKAL